MKWIPSSTAGRIVGVNTVLLLVLHAGRQLLNPATSILWYLVALAVGNFILGADALLHRRGPVTAVYLLAALLIGLIGFGDCVTHFRLHPQ